jgi:hypothetical protein
MKGDSEWRKMKPCGVLGGGCLNTIPRPYTASGMGKNRFKTRGDTRRLESKYGNILKMVCGSTLWSRHLFLSLLAVTTFVQIVEVLIAHPG